MKLSSSDTKTLANNKKAKDNFNNFNKVVIKKIKDIEIIKYSPKSIAVSGNTKEVKNELKLLGGHFNPYLKWNDKRFYGWIFKTDKLEEVIQSHYLLYY